MLLSSYQGSERIGEPCGLRRLVLYALMTTLSPNTCGISILALSSSG